MIDFGYGNGKKLMRCVAKGAERCVGIDISLEGFKRAKDLGGANNVGEKTDMLMGSIVDLDNYEENKFDVGILSNILDNLIPEDADKLLKNSIESSNQRVRCF